MKVEIDVPLAGLPADRKLSHVIAKYPEVGEWYLDMNNEWNKANINFSTIRIVAGFEPVETWRAATIEDAIRALQGELIRIRCKDSDVKTWMYGTLAGCSGIVQQGKPLFPWSLRTPQNGVCTFAICEVQEFK